MIEQTPPAPPECKTDDEKTAYAFGWYKAMEHKLNTTPPAAQRDWVELTDDEIRKEIPPYDAWKYEIGYNEAVKFFRVLEAKSKEKNYEN